MVWSKSKKHEEKVEDLEVPGSLPNTLMDKKGPVKKIEKVETQKQDKHLLPKDLVEEFKPVKQEVKEEPIQQVVEKSNDPSYFNELEKHFEQDKEISHKHFSDDLISKMKDYHESKMRGEAYFISEKDSDEHVYKHLLELKELEAEWSIRFRELEAAKELLMEKEKEIESKITIFKKVFAESEKFKLFNRKAPLELAFKLENGRVLRSVQDLVDELASMSDDVFYHHVTTSRNDFELWIRHVFNAVSLADKVKSVSSKQDLINILK